MEVTNVCMGRRSGKSVFNKYQLLTAAAQNCYDVAARFQSIGNREKALKWKRKGDVSAMLAREVGLYEVLQNK